MALAARLKAARMRKRKALQQLADDVSASKAHIWGLETGRARNPTIELLAKLATALDTSITNLVGENPEGADEESEIVTMYRELKDLDKLDRETIRLMIERLKKRQS